jgi:hypothetical protein
VHTDREIFGGLYLYPAGKSVLKNFTKFISSEVKNRKIDPVTRFWWNVFRKWRRGGQEGG